MAWNGLIYWINLTSLTWYGKIKEKYFVVFLSGIFEYFMNEESDWWALWRFHRKFLCLYILFWKDLICHWSIRDTSASEACNFTKSNTFPWVFFISLKLYIWYQTAQIITYGKQWNCIFRMNSRSIVAWMSRDSLLESLMSEV